MSTKKYWSRAGDFPFEVVELAKDDSMSDQTPYDAQLAAYTTFARLAGATKPCPKHPPIASLSQGKRLAKQCGCKEDRDYLFPDYVRVPCRPEVEACRDCRDGNTHSTIPSPMQLYPCDECAGRGWTPATDGFTWLNAVTQMSTDFIGRWARRWDDYTNNTYICRPPKDLEADFFTFLVLVVEATEGWELMKCGQ